jgi:hypothetical protein
MLESSLLLFCLLEVSRFAMLMWISLCESMTDVMYCKLLLDFIQFIVYSRAGSPEDQGALQKKRRTTGRARDFMVRIDFAAKVNMRAIDDVLRGLPGAQVDRAQDALRVLDIVLRESASSK